MIFRLATLIASLLLSFAAAAQTIQQSGNVTPGHIFTWVQSGIGRDAGAATNPYPTEFGIFKNGGLPFCIIASTTPRATFVPSTSPHTDLCLFDNQGGHGGFTLNSYNGAAPASMVVNINGTNYDFPAGGAGQGNVTGPVSSTVYDVALFNSSNGELITDGGALLATSVIAYGAVCDGSTDDTSAIESALNAGAAYIPAGLTCAVKDVEYTGPGLYGVAGSSTLTLTSAATSSDYILRYTGTGPTIVDGITFTCPYYNPAGSAGALAPAAGLYGFLAEPLSAAQVTGVYLNNVTVHGCGKSAGIEIYETADVRLTHITTDRQWGWGVIISDAFDTAAIHTHKIFVDDLHCTLTGAYCLSTPVDQSTTTAITSYDYQIKNSYAEGCGWLNFEGGFDFTGDAWQLASLEATSVNSYFAGEIKRAEAGGSPPAFQHIRAVLSAYDAVDKNGWYFDYENQSPTPSPQEAGKFVADVQANYYTAPAWTANTTYPLGYVVQNNSNLYMVATPGVSAGSGGPSTTGTPCSGTMAGGGSCDGIVGVGITDNTIQWWYLGSVSTFSVTAWATSTPYRVGDYVTANSKIYVADTGGTSAGSGGGPSCTSGTCTDNNILWSFAQNGSALYAGVEFPAVILADFTDPEIHLHTTGFWGRGFQILPRGSSDAVMRRADLWFDGITTGACIIDTAPSGGTGATTAYVNQLTIHPTCRTLGEDDGAIQLGYSDATYNVNYAGIKLVGGYVYNPGYWGFYTNGTTGSIQGTVLGTEIAGNYGGYYFTEPVTLRQSGGIVETLSASGDAPITGYGSTATGSFTALGPLPISNASSGSFGSTSDLSSAAVAFTGQYATGTFSSIPTTQCNWGDIAYSTQPGNSMPVTGWYCSSPTSTWTAADAPGTQASWTPTDASGASLTLTVNQAQYFKTGRLCVLEFNITYPSTADTSNAMIGGVPAACKPLNVTDFDAAASFAEVYYTTPITAAIHADEQMIYFSTYGGGAVENTNLSTTTINGQVVIITE